MHALHYKLKKLNELPTRTQRMPSLFAGCKPQSWLQAVAPFACPRYLLMASRNHGCKPQSWLQAVATFMAASLRHITGALILEARRV